MKKLYIILYVMILLSFASFVSANTINQSLIAYYTLDNVITSNDTAAYNGAWGNAGTYVANCKVNGCYNFTSASSHYFTSTSNYVFGNNPDRTECAWIYPYDYTAYHGILGQPSFEMQLLTDSSAQPLVRSYDAPVEQILTCTMTLPSDQWIYFCAVFTGGNAEIYINGTSACSGANGIDADNSALEIGRGYRGAYYYWEGMIDEVGFWNRAMNAQNITALYNNYLGNTYPFVGVGAGTGNVATPSFIKPRDNEHNNTNTTIEINCTNNNTYLWFDTNTNPITPIWENATNTTWATNLSDGTYYFKAACWNDAIISSNTSTRTLFIDTVTPTITINGNNGFNTSNMSDIDQYSNYLFMNITANDESNLFGFLVNITKGGVSYFNHTNISINLNSHNFTKNISTSSWLNGVYNIEVTAADGHTAKKIDYYDVSKTSNKLSFKTAERNTIEIIGDGATSVRYAKKTDRYEFGFDYSKKSTEKQFIIRSSNKIYLVPNSKYNAHFVVWNGKGGNWIDFEGIGNEYTITKNNDYEYEILFTGLTSSDKIDAKSIGGLNSITQNYTWYKGVYSSNTPPGQPSAYSVFTFNITKDDAYISGVNVSLTYNNTFRNLNKTTFTNYIIYNTTVMAPIEISGSEVNISYIWDVRVNQSNGNGYNFTIHGNQTVYNWGLDNCSLYSTIAINFTLTDESNGSIIDGDITGTFNYTANYITYKTFNLSLVDVSNFSICIQPSYATIYADYELTYSADNYPQRTYSKTNSLINNVTVALPLYLLFFENGIYARFRVVDIYENPISGVKITMVLSGTTIEVETTDDAGLATFWADQDTTYAFTFTKTGYTTQTFNLKPISSDIYTVTMVGEGEGYNMSVSSGVTYSFYPQNIVLSNNTNYNFSFTLNSTLMTVSNCTLRMRNSSNIFTQSSSSFTPSSCDITVEYNTGNLTSIISEAIYIVNGTQVTVNYPYAIIYTYTGQFSLKNFFDDLTNFAGAGFNDFTRMIIAFIVIFALVAWAASYIGFNNPEVLVLLTWALTGFFSYVGWFTLNLSTIPNIIGLKKYVIFYVISLVTAAIMAEKFMR